MNMTQLTFSEALQPSCLSNSLGSVCTKHISDEQIFSHLHMITILQHSFAYYHLFCCCFNIFTDSLSAKPKEEISSLFQRQRVDVLLAELTRSFPPKVYQVHLILEML